LLPVALPASAHYRRGWRQDQEESLHQTGSAILAASACCFHLSASTSFTRSHRANTASPTPSTRTYGKYLGTISSDRNVSQLNPASIIKPPIIRGRKVDLRAR